MQWSLTECGGSAYWGQLTPGRCARQLLVAGKDDFVTEPTLVRPWGELKVIPGLKQGGRVGWGTGPHSLPLSPQKPSKHCPGGCSTDLTLDFREFSIATASVLWDKKERDNWEDCKEQRRKWIFPPDNKTAPKQMLFDADMSITHTMGWNSQIVI